MSPLQVNGQVSYAYFTKIKKPQQNTLARLCEPRIEHLILKGVAKVVKQSLQLVNLWRLLRRTSVLILKMHAAAAKTGKSVDDFVTFVIIQVYK